MSIDIHGDYKWATQWEDDIALNIYEKWLKAAGGESGREDSRIQGFKSNPLEY